MSSKSAPVATAGRPWPEILEELTAIGERLGRDKGRRWLILHTLGRQEKVIARDLAARGVQHFFPSFIQRTTHGHGTSRRNVVVERPVFPGYVFLFGELDDAYAVDRGKRLANILQVENQAHLQWELLNLAKALSSGAGFDPYPHLKAGTRVMVTSGPYIGLEGWVADRRAPDRLVLQVDLLGQAMSMELGGAMVRVLDDPAERSKS